MAMSFNMDLFPTCMVVYHLLSIDTQRADTLYCRLPEYLLSIQVSYSDGE